MTTRTSEFILAGAIEFKMLLVALSQNQLSAIVLVNIMVMEGHMIVNARCLCIGYDQLTFFFIFIFDLLYFHFRINNCN
jgi:hypothetical protein